MSRDRRRLLVAVVAALVIIAGGWLLRRGGDEPAAAPSAPPPTAPPDGFQWVGSGHVVVAVPSEWEADDTGCERPPCSAGGDGGRVSTVSIAFTLDDEVSPRDESVRIDGVAALRSEVDCVGSGCTGRVLVPAEHVVVVVKGASEDEVESLLDGVHVLEDLVAVPETRYADRPAATDARRFRDWAESLGLQVTYQAVVMRDEPAGAVPSAQPPTGTMVEPGSTVVAHVVGPVPDEPACTDLRVTAGGEQVYPSTEPVRVTLEVGQGLDDMRVGSCAEHVTLAGIDRKVLDRRGVAQAPGTVTLTWRMPFCGTLDESARSTCLGGSARLGSAVVTVTP